MSRFQPTHAIIDHGTKRAYTVSNPRYVDSYGGPGLKAEYCYATDPDRLRPVTGLWFLDRITLVKL